jgi:hypothetical protein
MKNMAAAKHRVKTIYHEKKKTYQTIICLAAKSVMAA